MNLFSFYKLITDFIVYKVFSLNPSSGIAESLHFFIYSNLKIFTIILFAGFFIGLLNGLISPNKTKKLLSGKKTGLGNVLAAILAVFTPVDSFSVLPIFSVFVEAGIPVGIIFTYLISAPMTNELAFALFWGMLGPKIAFTYIICGVLIGILMGMIIEAFNPEKYVHSFITDEKIKKTMFVSNKSIKARLIAAWRFSVRFLKGIWLYVLIGVALAGLIQQYIPAFYLIKYAKLNYFIAIPVIVLMVFFLYINIAVALPVITIFIGYSLPIGTVLAFTMAITGASIPELLILKKAVKTPLLVLYVTSLIILIIFCGYILNAIFIPKLI